MKNAKTDDGQKEKGKTEGGEKAKQAKVLSPLEKAKRFEIMLNKYYPDYISENLERISKILAWLEKLDFESDDAKEIIKKTSVFKAAKRMKYANHSNIQKQAEVVQQKFKSFGHDTNSPKCTTTGKMSPKELESYKEQHKSKPAHSNKGSSKIVKKAPPPKKAKGPRPLTKVQKQEIEDRERWEKTKAMLAKQKEVAEKHRKKREEDERKVLEDQRKALEEKRLQEIKDREVREERMRIEMEEKKRLEEEEREKRLAKIQTFHTDFDLAEFGSTEEYRNMVRKKIALSLNGPTDGLPPDHWTRENSVKSAIQIEEGIFLTKRMERKHLPELSVRNYRKRARYAMFSMEDATDGRRAKKIRAKFWSKDIDSKHFTEFVSKGVI